MMALRNWRVFMVSTRNMGTSSFPCLRTKAIRSARPATMSSAEIHGMSDDVTVDKP